jgi:hypothetical protein
LHSSPAASIRSYAANHERSPWPKKISASRVNWTLADFSSDQIWLEKWCWAILAALRELQNKKVYQKYIMYFQNLIKSKNRLTRWEGRRKNWRVAATAKSSTRIASGNQTYRTTLGCRTSAVASEGPHFCDRSHRLRRMNVGTAAGATARQRKKTRN